MRWRARRRRRRRQAEKAKVEADVEKKKSELKTQEEKAKVEIAKLEKLQKEKRSSASTPPMIYLSSSGNKDKGNTPNLDDAIKAYLQGTVASGDSVSIIELNDAKPEYHPEHKYMPFHPAEQDIYKTVREAVNGLGYQTRLMPYMVSQGDSKLDKLLSCFSKRGTICVVVGGETWRLADEFAKAPGLRDLITANVRRGDLMYVSFSAGSVMAGPTVEIHTDTDSGKVKCLCPDPPGITHKKNGFSLVLFAMRPHNNVAAGKAFEEKAAGRSKMIVAKHSSLMCSTLRMARRSSLWAPDILGCRTLRLAGQRRL